MRAPEFVVYAKFARVFSVTTFRFEYFKFLNIKFVCLAWREIHLPISGTSE